MGRLGRCWRVELYFSFGSLTGHRGATIAHRPSALFLDRTGSANCKVVALSWDQDTTQLARGVRITYDPAIGTSPIK